MERVRFSATGMQPHKVGASSAVGASGARPRAPLVPATGASAGGAAASQARSVEGEIFERQRWKELLRQPLLRGEHVHQ